MARQRRTFTKQYKTETVKEILRGTLNKNEFSRSANIALPLLDRWINDYVATSKLLKVQATNMSQFKERRKNFYNEQELKAKIAELYLMLEREQKILPAINLTA